MVYPRAYQTRVSEMVEVGALQCFSRTVQTVSGEALYVLATRSCIDTTTPAAGHSNVFAGRGRLSLANDLLDYWLNNQEYVSPLGRRRRRSPPPITQDIELARGRRLFPSNTFNARVPRGRGLRLYRSDTRRREKTERSAGAGFFPFFLRVVPLNCYVLF